MLILLLLLLLLFLVRSLSLLSSWFHSSSPYSYSPLAVPSSPPPPPPGEWVSRTWAGLALPDSSASQPAGQAAAA
eukprot:5578216-Pyramimonas_sp.AAC.1